MKKVYVSHSKNFNYKTQLYRPLKSLKGIEFIFPHQTIGKITSSKNVIKSCSVIIAEVSRPSYGVGIEIGWANSFGIPIIFIYKKGSKISSSLKIVSKDFIEYDQVENILDKINKKINL